jgi:ABC-type glutathione transport system ATPase component
MAATTEQVYPGRRFTGEAKHSMAPMRPWIDPTTDGAEPAAVPAMAEQATSAAAPTTAQFQAVDPTKEPVVVVDNLHVKYKVFSSGKAAGTAGAKGLFQRSARGLKEVHALKGISFTAYKNESIGIIGSNGSGAVRQRQHHPRLPGAGIQQA